MKLSQPNSCNAPNSRQHPKIDQPKALDVLVEELDSFKDIGDLVILEIRLPNGTTSDVYVRLADFNKVAPDMDQVVQAARGTRGRLPGSRHREPADDRTEMPPVHRVLAKRG